MKNSVKLGVTVLAISVTMASCLWGAHDQSKKPDTSATTVTTDTTAGNKPIPQLKIPPRIQ